MNHDTHQVYLVRALMGERPQVYRLRTREDAKRWRFKSGVTVVDESLSEALFQAQQLLGAP